MCVELSGHLVPSEQWLPIIEQFKGRQKQSVEVLRANNAQYKYDTNNTVEINSR